MKVLVGFEESQIGCKAFRARGHEAYSCDLEDCSGGKPQWHIKKDIREVMYDGWDLAIFHPYCTYNTNAANRWLYEDCAATTAEERHVLRDEGLKLFQECLDAPIDKICCENPFPHPYVISVIGPFQDMVQPWMFGEPETKGLCLWLKNLPPLMSTIISAERQPKVHKMAPGPERTKERSKSFPLVMAAMADQWGEA